VNWPEQIRIRNSILEGEQATAARNERPVAPVRDWWLAAEEQARQAEAARTERDRDATVAHQARLQKNAQAGQDAQAAWAQTRATLRAAVVEAQAAAASCERRIDGADFDDAVRAAAELVVYRARVEAAQTGYAQHCQRSPL
jgi:hypothetical protein